MKRMSVPAVAVLCLTILTTLTRAQEASRPAVAPIEFVYETLDNGLRVIYAPLKTAPVVHVRVLYHVGSKDERPDRQGFAHMFEHMMFRGSAHVEPEEHMKLVGTVGGSSNAFTSLDQTVYVNTVPANHLEMVLYLEADRMASFKVSEEIYRTERNVVGQEWRMRYNRPYGNMHEEFMRLAYQRHGYRWTTIGNLDHLAAAEASELQAFFNTYYVPNNAVLVIAGDIDVPEARKQVARYFGWIPRGGQIVRRSPAEPEQAEPRRLVKQETVPAPAIMMGYKLPPYEHNDHDALAMLATILSGGRSGRLDVALVNNDKPTCTSVSAGPWQLEDGGIFFVNANVMAGQDYQQVEQILHEQVRRIAEEGVTADELEKARTAARIGWAQSRETASSIAAQLGHEALFSGDPDRVNSALARLEAVTVEDIQRVARMWLVPQRCTTVVFVPRGTPVPEASATMPANSTTQPAAQDDVAREVDPADVPPRVVSFPPDWSPRPPMSDQVLEATFEKGVETRIGSARVIVMSDRRLPLVSWSVTMRQGSHTEQKEGLGWITAEMVRRGPEGTTFQEFNEYLESRGIRIEVGDGGDYTRIGGSSMSDQLAEGLRQTRRLLLQPLFSPTEFQSLRGQLIDVLRRQQADAGTVAANDLNEAIFGDTPLGRYATPESLASITLDDVKAYFNEHYVPDDAIVVIAGDVSVEQGQQLAAELLAGWERSPTDRRASYDFPRPPGRRRIILVDRPEARQSTVRMGILAYDIHTDEKFAGVVSNQILTAGIESRLGKYVRAQKGLAYSVYGVFQPMRQGGSFRAGTDTSIETTAQAVEAMFEVFEQMRTRHVTAQELRDAQLRVAGAMVMSLQTIGQQAQMRVDGILNGYPIDYYDRYPQRIAEVTLDQVQQVMQRYVKDEAMTIVVVAPAEKVREQLEKLGEVQVIPMPAERKPATRPAKKAA